MNLNLHTADLALRVDDCTPYHLLEALRAISGPLTEIEAYATDYLLQAWTLRACLTGDLNAIGILDTTLAYLNERETSLAHQAKWEAYRGLLAARCLLLPDDSDIHALLEDETLLQLLGELPADGQFVALDAITSAACFSPERLSQYLGQLSDYGLTEARLRHKSRDWRITPAGLYQRQKRSPLHQDL